MYAFLRVAQFTRYLMYLFSVDDWARKTNLLGLRYLRPILFRQGDRPKESIVGVAGANETIQEKSKLLIGAKESLSAS
jgi:hypothetical protein